MKTIMKTHRSGMQVVPSNLISDVEDAISQTDSTIVGGKAQGIRSSILNYLMVKGWSNKIPLSNRSGITITSIKDKVGLCLQTGNVSRMYADLLKLQKFYTDSMIVAGILVVPSRTLAKQLGSNVTNSDRLLKELKIFENIITSPLVILSME